MKEIPYYAYYAAVLAVGGTLATTDFSTSKKPDLLSEYAGHVVMGNLQDARRLAKQTRECLAKRSQPEAQNELEAMIIDCAYSFSTKMNEFERFAVVKDLIRLYKDR